MGVGLDGTGVVHDARAWRLFYGGMVRAKNVLGMLMQNFFAMGILAIVWVAIVFSLAFGNAGDGGWIGNLDFAWMHDVGPGARRRRSSVP